MAQPLSEITRQRRVAVGLRLSVLRRERGLTQEALAHRAGFDRSFYVELETAKHTVTLDRVFDLADALGLSVSELLENL